MLSQQHLFGSSPVPLVADNEGGIRYLPDCIDANQAAQWFAALLENVEWKAHRRMMYEREIDVPRLSADYADYADNGPNKLPEPLSEAFETMRAVVGAPFNTVGLNLYRDEKDSVAQHSDKVQRLIPGQPIAILSLGDTRRMSIRGLSRSSRVRHIDLEAGSVLVMSYESQLTHEHGIPKLVDKRGPRISLAFRCYQIK